MQVCECCGELFLPKKLTSRYCKRECYLKGTEKKKCTCKYCGKEYTPKRPDRNQYCCREHAFAAHTAKHNTRGILPVVVIPCGTCGTRIAQGKYCKGCSKIQARVWASLSAICQMLDKEYICKTCGKIFIPEYGTHQRLFCNETCRGNWKRKTKKANRKFVGTFNSVGRKKLRAFYGEAWREYYEPINKKLVYERDGWKCQLCGCKLKLTQQWAEKQATVDHIIPMALGGEHKYMNVQAACMKCNSAKSHVGGGQLRLLSGV